MLLRLRLPDRPGMLGAVATAIGQVDADIHAVEILERGEGYAIDDFILSIPAGTLPDTLVSACTSVDDVQVIWLSRYSAHWGLESDIETVNRMAEEPHAAAEILVEDAPVGFHSSWAALVSTAGPALVHGTDLAPEFDAHTLARLGRLDELRTEELPAEWLPGWGVTVVAITPLPGDRAIVLGRQGGPGYLRSELVRLRHLAALAS
jgi:hypothetical protein